MKSLFKKSLIILSIFISNSLSAQYQYEEYIYDCVTKELLSRNFEVTKGLELFEKQLDSLGHLNKSTSIFKLYRDQTNSLMPLRISSYVRDIDVRYNDFNTQIAACYSKPHQYKKGLKYHKVKSRIEKLAPPHLPGSIWEEMHTVLEEKDYEHYFYRMIALVMLHSFSIDTN